MSQPEFVWSGEDYQVGLCRADQIGTPKPLTQVIPLEGAEAVIAELPKATMAELKQAALRVARGKMGFDKFFEQYPSFHHKFLLAISRESTPPPPAQVNVSLSWLSPSRLSYKNEPEESKPLVLENNPEPKETED